MRPPQQRNVAHEEEEPVTSKKNQHYTGDDEIIERNMERSREVIEARRREHGQDNAVPFDEDAPAPENARDDLQDVPVGGQSGPNFRGGTAKRHKAG